MKITRSALLAAFSIIAILAIPGPRMYVLTPVGALQPNQMSALQVKLLGGFASLVLLPSDSLAANANSDPISYVPSSSTGCSTTIGSNAKVNQNCLNISDPSFQGRGQAQNEPSIAADAFNTNHVVASYNDYRRGDGTCGVSYSLDGGQTWQDSTTPNGFTRGAAFGAARQYWQASGDTAVAWDTQGNAYLQCMMFMRGTPTTNNPDFSSAIYVYRSTGNFGASWNFPARPVVQDKDFNGSTLQDKPYMTVDNHVGSPFQDRVYVTWTNFAADGTVKIYESHSNDFGEHFSAPVLVSTPSSLCPLSIGSSGNCDANQFSDPFTGPDGALYVAWDNFNNAVAGTPMCGSFPCDNHNQILLAKSTDGGVSFSAPVKVANWYDLPDCATYQNGQDLFRACVPEKGSATNSVFRATNYPSGAVNPKKPSQVAITFGSYINPNSQESNGCTPNGLSTTTFNNLYTGVKAAGACNNDILLSVSNDAGATFTGANTDPRSLTSVTQASGQATTDQWWQWAAFTKNGVLAVSYYDRQYGNDETTGTSDISVSVSNNLASFSALRASSSSMPLPTQFTNGFGNGVFYGDYAGLTVASGNLLPVWSDTRDSDLFLCPGTGTPGVAPAVCTATEPNGLAANDQDIFTTIT
jgi:hypothetical protein